VTKALKKYDDVKKMIDREKKYSIADAVAILKKAARASFDETVDMALHLGVNPKKSDQSVRGTVSLPAGTGKTIKVLVLTKSDKYKEAEAAGADYVGAEDLIDKIAGGWIDFDIVLATPDIMPAVGKLGKTLGTKGLMPNPKAGTVSNDIGKAVKEFKAGKTEFKMDKGANLHLGIGKMSFKEKDIEANMTAVVETISRAKPNGFKGVFLKSVTVSTTMGPGIKLDVAKIVKGAENE